MGKSDRGVNPLLRQQDRQRKSDQRRATDDYCARTENGIVGDVDFDAVQGIAGAVTPMPGGTGLLTVACLMENTVAAAVMQGVRI